MKIRKPQGGRDPPEAEARSLRFSLHHEGDNVMKNAYAIGDLAGLLGKNAEVIENIAMGMNNAEQGDNPELVESYKVMLLNSLETAQHSILTLTKLVTEIAQDREEHGDSVFMPGELDNDLGREKNVKNLGKEEEEK